MQLGIHDFTLFVISGILLNLTPGPDTLYVVSRAAHQGRRAGLIAALGIGSGCFVHIFAASIGLSALIMTSALAFNVVRLLGAAYLVYIGVMLLRSRVTSGERHSASNSTAVNAPFSAWQVYAQGFLTNALNPKVALFFLAFLPQFIVPAAENKTVAFLLLGLVFDFNGTVWLLLVALLTAQLSQRTARHREWLVWRDRAIGAMFVGLGARLAWQR